MGYDNFFSRFMAKRIDIKMIENKEVMVILDEPDIFMHPEWQRVYISVLKEFFEKFYKDKKIKIILTSHSPFVASDLPRENVIMLDTYDEKDEETKRDKEDPKYQKNGNCKVVNDKKIKTFGANIFDLYTEAFFVTSSFGEFAKRKIKEVVKELTPDDKNKYGIIAEERVKEIEYIINSIGEKLVKNKMQKMYDEYRNHKDSEEYKKEQIKELKKKIGINKDELQKLLDNGDLDD